MPELEQYPFEAPEILSELGALEYADRDAKITLMRNYYDRQQKRALKVRKGQPDDNVILNVTRRVIDQGASLLFGVPPKLLIEEAKQAKMNAWWEVNEWEVLLYNMAVAGSMSGHVFVKLNPDDRKGVRLTLLNPEMVTVFWHPRDKAQIVCYKVEWKSGTTTWRQDIARDGNNWLIRDLHKRDNSTWTIDGDVNWTWPFAPVADWQNLPNRLQYYGDPDIGNLEMNDAINFSASNINRILKIHAHPKTIGVGMQANQVSETAVDGFWAIPNPEAKIANLEMQSDLASSMAFLNFLEGSFYSENRAVDLSTIRDKLGQITNFGLRLLYQDALEKLQLKRTLYGNGLKEIAFRAGEMMSSSWGQPALVWQDTLPQDGKALREAALIDKQLGVSNETLMGKLGYDAAVETAKRANEDKDVGNDLLSAFDKGGA